MVNNEHLSSEPIIAEVSPKPTVLYHIQPIDIGTPNVESLTGFIANLAKEHMVTVLTLFKYVILPLLKEQATGDMPVPVYSQPASEIVALGKSLNGITTTTQRILMIISYLTGSTSLEFTTFVSWTGTISPIALMRRYHAWCPLCFNQQRDDGIRIHDLLNWSLKGVDWCTIHRCSFEQCCPVCGKNLSRLSSSYQAGFCSYCNSWLGHTTSKDWNLNDPKTQLFREYCAQTTGELIALMPRLALENNRLSLKMAIKACVTELAGGKYGRFARIIGGVINAWQLS